MSRALALCALLLAACGSVTARDVDAGAGGQLGAGGSAGAAPGGQGGHAGDVVAAGGAAGTPTTSTGGAAGAAETCLPPNTTGFALNIDQPCSVGDAAACSYKTGRCCYAACTLNGAPFVGCLEGSTVASRCYASCSDCP